MKQTEMILFALLLAVFDDPPGDLAADLGDLTLEVAHASLSCIALDDGLQSGFADLDAGLLQSMGL